MDVSLRKNHDLIVTGTDSIEPAPQVPGCIRQLNDVGERNEAACPGLVSEHGREVMQKRRKDNVTVSYYCSIPTKFAHIDSDNCVINKKRQISSYVQQEQAKVVQ